MNFLVPSLRYLPLAAVLLVAAIGKAWWLPAEDRIDLFQHPLLLNTLIVTEVILAAALLWLAPLFPGWARWLGTLLFASFAVYSASAWLRDEPFQCFGLAAVSPLVPLTFDVAAIAWLWFPIQSNPIRKSLVGFTVTSMATWLGIFWPWSNSNQLDPNVGDLQQNATQSVAFHSMETSP